MIDLDRVLLLRAEEQMEAATWRYDDAGELKPKGRQPTCLCGTCGVCRRRLSMQKLRERRAAGRGPENRGASYDLGKRCRFVYQHADDEVCGEKIADHNQSGYCDTHRRVVWDHQRRDRRKRR
jgi:hypothetical protein